MFGPDDGFPWQHPEALESLAVPGEQDDNVTQWARHKKWLERVAETPERDLRGHRIALTYHALAIDLYRWIYDCQGKLSQDNIVGQKPRVNANWFHFGTWATATLNADIRNDDPPYRSDRLVPPGFYRRLTPTVLAIKSANRQRYNQLLTWYQRMVFINTTFAYNAMREYVGADADKVFAEITNNGDIDVKSKDWMEKAQTAVKPRDGDAQLLVERHLAPVAMACDYYRRARTVTLHLKKLDERSKDLDERSKAKLPTPTQIYFQYLRARLVLLGNLIITSVEQDVVNPGVMRVLNSVPTAATDYLSNHLARFAQRTFGVPRQLAGLRIPVKLEPAEDLFEQMWARVLTRQLLVLALPAETLRLGHDIPPLAAGEPFFPPELFDLRGLPPLFDEHDGHKVPLDDVFELPGEGYVSELAQHDVDNFNLLRTVSAFDRSRGDGCGTGASDWRRLPERLNWATTLLRTRIQDASLFWPPFRNEDVERIFSGKLPLHSGNPTDFDVLGPLESFGYINASEVSEASEASHT